MEIPSGFRFQPTDRGVITDYLLPMVKNQSLLCEDVIIRKNIYGIDQEDISLIFEKCSSTNKFYDEHEDVLYFYTPLSKISGKAKNICRVAGPGTWTGQDAGKEIFDSQRKVLGFKKTFNFTYSNEQEAGSSTGPAAKKRKNSSSSSGISWIMHEFSLPPSACASPQPSSSNGQAIEHVICKIRRKQAAGQISSKRYPVKEPVPIPDVAANSMVINDAPPVPLSTVPAPAHFVNPSPPVQSITIPASTIVNSSPIQPVNVRAPTFINPSPAQSVMAPVVDQQNCYNNYYYLNQMPAITMDVAHLIPTLSIMPVSNYPLTEASASTSQCASHFAASTSMPTNNQAPVLDKELQQICEYMRAHEDIDSQPTPLSMRKMESAINTAPHARWTPATIHK